MKNSLSIFLPITIALLLTSLLTLALGESPLLVAEILVRGAFGSPTAIGYTLYYATPLIFTGLAVAWSLQAGLFNIGAEGQMTMGGIAMAAAGILASGLPSYVAVPFALLAGMVAGALWASAVAWLKIRRQVHEVLGSILFNFISYGIAGFLILDVLRNRESQNPETLPVGAGFELITFTEWFGFGGTSPLNLAFFFAIGVAIIVDIVLQRTIFGLRVRWKGGAPEFARRSGISISSTTIKTFAISGAIAGLAGASVVLGYMHKAREGLAGGAGFVGIAVALLGGGRAWGVIAAAILFGALQKGALDLDLDTENVSRDISVVIQAIIVLAVAARGAMTESFQILKAKLFRPKEEGL